MSCYHPLKAFILGVNENTGKKIIKISGRYGEYVQQRGDNFEIVNAYYGNDVSQLKIHNAVNSSHEGKIFRDWIPVPCGKCIGCRLDYSARWANRLMLEYASSNDAIFLTLTYNDDHVPWNRDHSYMTLKKKDVQDFLKRLRKKLYNSSKGDLRFYCCGEYGSTTNRPHYHLILFNYRPKDLTLHKTDGHGFNYFLSDELSSIWGNGFILVADVNWNTCAYVSRYVVKKLNGDLAQVYKEKDILPEFSTMSRRPGISNYLFDDELKERMLCGQKSVFISTSEGGKEIPLPKYYYNMLEEEGYSSAVSDVKAETLETYLNSIQTKLDETDMSFYEMLKHEEDAFKARLSTKHKMKRRNVDNVEI